MKVAAKNTSGLPKKRRVGTLKAPRRAKSPSKPATAGTLHEELKPFIGIIKDGPADLARHHPQYASGSKKWK